jgi:type VI secretion system protein
LSFQLSKTGDWRNGRGFVPFAALALGIVLLAGCSSGPPEIETRTLDFEIGAKANDDTALAVDLVLVFDQTLIGQIAGLPATTWFQTRDQVKLANPTGLEVRSFEVIPGQPGAHVDITGDSRDAIAAFVFASYTSPGPHRARVDGLRSVLLRFGGKDFAVAVPPS